MKIRVGPLPEFAKYIIAFLIILSIPMFLYFFSFLIAPILIIALAVIGFLIFIVAPAVGLWEAVKWLKEKLFGY